MRVDALIPPGKVLRVTRPPTITEDEARDSLELFHELLVILAERPGQPEPALVSL